MEKIDLSSVPTETEDSKSAETKDTAESIREQQRASEIIFEEKKSEYTRFLQFWDIWDKNLYSEVKEKVERENLFPEHRDSFLACVREMQFEMATAALENDANLYQAFLILESLGETDLIKARADKSPRTVTGELYYYLALAILDYCSDDKAEALIKEWVTERGGEIVNLENTKYFKERLTVIGNSFSAFAQAQGLPSEIPRLSSNACALHFINAAVEFKRRGYDVAIGIMNSGVHLAALLDYIGQPTRYVEWHSNWKKPPVWRNIGSEHGAITRATKILLCEHDIHTGKTLDTLKPFLKKLGPAEVDVSCWVDMHGAVAGYTEKSDFYDASYMVGNMPLDHFVENINEVYKYAKSDKTRLLV